MTRAFNLSELMGGGCCISDPVTGRGETREDAGSDSLLNGECNGCRGKKQRTKAQRG